MPNYDFYFFKTLHRYIFYCLRFYFYFLLAFNHFKNCVFRGSKCCVEKTFQSLRIHLGDRVKMPNYDFHFFKTLHRYIFYCLRFYFYLLLAFIHFINWVFRGYKWRVEKIFKCLRIHLGDRVKMPNYDFYFFKKTS